MKYLRTLAVLVGTALCSGSLFSASVILNEYNGVADSNQIGGGSGSDTFFPLVNGNGGNWLELVVVGDGTAASTVDMRGWSIEVFDSDDGSSSITLSQNSYWQNVQAGTLLTFTEDNTSAGGLDSDLSREDRLNSEGWAWSNIWIQDGTLIDLASSDSVLHTSNQDTAITIRDDQDVTVFGPAGEDIASEGVNSEEVLALQETPSPSVATSSVGYNDVDNSSFGSPNPLEGSGTQSFLAFRIAGPAPGFTTPIADTFLTAGNPFAETVTASDANGGTLTIDIQSGPDWLSIIDNGDGSADLSGTPADEDAGIHPVVLEVTDDPQDGSDILAFTITVFASSVPVIVNEYDGGGEWLELVVVGNGSPGSTVDLRGWSLSLEDDNGSGTIQLSNDDFWSNVQAGTILLFSEDDAANGGFDTNIAAQNLISTAGWASATFWIGDETYLDSTNTSAELSVSNDDAIITVLNDADEFIFGPVGEGIESDGGVSGSERFILDADPSTQINPIAGDYADSDSSTPGQPNLKSEGSLQNFEAFSTGTNPNSPPFFTAEPAQLLDYAVEIPDEYFWIVTTEDPNAGDTLTITLSEGPDWLTLDDFGDGSADLFGTPALADAGTHPIEIEVTDGEFTVSQNFEVFAFATSSPVVLNEFNAVADNSFLNGGDEGTDSDSGAAADGFFGRVAGNGGDWFELVVVGDGSAGSTIDLRGWSIEISEDGNPPESIILSQDSYWQNVQAGSILTFTEDSFDDGGLDTAIHRVNRFDNGGWAWTNILVNDPTYVDLNASTFNNGFPASNADLRITLKDATGTVRSGPAGEEFLSLGGLGDTEVFKLEQDPTPLSASPLSASYSDGTSSSFGAPNQWNSGQNTQNFSAFETNTPGNSRPFFNFVSPFFARQGDSFSYSVTASDEDGTGSLTLSLDTGPPWISLIDGGNGSGTLTGTPSSSDATGLQTVTVSVDDGIHSVSKTFSLYIHPVTATVILNEYNAVAQDEFLNGGTLALDDEGGTASDPHFGRIAGNGGDWFELVVVGDSIEDGVDLRGWTIEIADNASFPFAAEERIVLSSDTFWSDVPTGTILTFTEKRTSEGGLDTSLNALDNRNSEGWAWSNVWIGDSTLISYTDEVTNGYSVDGGTGEVRGINTSNNDTWFVIRDSANSLIFGPAGEGIAPASGIGGTEVFELQADPDPAVSPLIAFDNGPPVVDGYDDSSSSTFGRPNDWSAGTNIQDFSSFIPSSGGSNPVETYLAGFGLSGADLQFDADSDKDGALQILEFAFATDPTSGASLPVLREGQQIAGANEHFTLTFLRRSGGNGAGNTYTADGIVYIVEGSLDLNGWNEPVEATTNPNGLPVAPTDYEWSTFRLVTPIRGANPSDRGFMRITLEQNSTP
ncbi:MAG: hypothetical protein AAGJ81_03745 [Verrucomicrobiota bacterium]